MTGTFAFAVLAVALGLAIFARSTLGTEYLEFALALVFFLVIIVGSYWFVVLGGRGGRD